MLGLLILVVAAVLLVAFLARTRQSPWRTFEETVRPPDDLRRADDGYEFPDGNSTGGWV